MCKEQKSKLESDLISRQAAIEAWDKLSKRGRTEFDQVLMTLPSAETHAKRTETHGVCSDCISRQAAIDALCRECTPVGYECRADCTEVEILRKLPPVEPEPVCEDCIDRYAVLAELDPQSYEYKVAKELPSVVPTTEQIKASAKRPRGEWIPCSERLPEEDGLYLVTTSKGQVQVHVFNHDGNSEEYWMRCNKAWMPLPEPYREESEVE